MPAGAVALEALSDRLGISGTLAESAQTGEDLFGVADVLRAEPSLRRVACDAAIDADTKAEIVQQVFGDAVGARTLAVVGEGVRRRWVSSHDLVDTLEQVALVALVRSAGKDASSITDELFAARQVIDGAPQLRNALADPGRSPQDRAGLIRDIFHGSVLPSTLRLLERAVTGPARTLDTAVVAYQRVAAWSLGEIIATVHSARELTASEQQRLVDSLGKQYDAAVHLHLVVRPGLVGGVRVEIGDDVIDGTMVTRLHEAQRKLAG